MNNTPVDRSNIADTSQAAASPFDRQVLRGAAGSVFGGRQPITWPAALPNAGRNTQPCPGLPD
ncbi:MAG TPA: hypothetical protein VFW60_07895 [Rhodanobacteraceae bacterium]|nr:hypothetical protein [Rhodanobacteraceae bacterium]